MKAERGNMVVAAVQIILEVTPHDPEEVDRIQAGMRAQCTSGDDMELFFRAMQMLWELLHDFQKRVAVKRVQ